MNRNEEFVQYLMELHTKYPSVVKGQELYIRFNPMAKHSISVRVDAPINETGTHIDPKTANENIDSILRLLNRVSHLPDQVDDFINLILFFNKDGRIDRSQYTITCPFNSTQKYISKMKRLCQKIVALNEIIIKPSQQGNGIAGSFEFNDFRFIDQNDDPEDISWNELLLSKKYLRDIEKYVKEVMKSGVFIVKTDEKGRVESFKSKLPIRHFSI